MNIPPSSSKPCSPLRYSGHVRVDFRGFCTLLDLSDAQELAARLAPGDYFAELWFIPLVPSLHETEAFRLLRDNVICDDARAERWFYTSHGALHGLAPVECMDSDQGRAQVLDLIHGLVHGHYL